MRVELTTSGGLTGRGIGSVRVDGNQVTVDGRVTVQITATEAALLHRLPVISVDRRGPTDQPDAVLFTLSIDGRRWTWSELAAPPDCRTWSETLMLIRRRVLDDPAAAR